MLSTSPILISCRVNRHHSASNDDLAFQKKNREAQIFNTPFHLLLESLYTKAKRHILRISFEWAAIFRYKIWSAKGYPRPRQWIQWPNRRTAAMRPVIGGTFETRYCHRMLLSSPVSSFCSSFLVFPLPLPFNPQAPPARAK